MNELIYRSLREHPACRDELLRRVRRNSDWAFLYGWLLGRLAEPERDGLPRICAVFDAQETMVGYYVLSAREVIRHPPEIKPWLGIILVFDGHRGKKYSPQMIAHACGAAKAAGYDELYLITEHDDYYERFGFTFLRSERYKSGAPTRLYRRAL